MKIHQTILTLIAVIPLAGWTALHPGSAQAGHVAVQNPTSFQASKLKLKRKRGYRRKRLHSGRRWHTKRRFGRRVFIRRRSGWRGDMTPNW